MPKKLLFAEETAHDCKMKFAKMTISVVAMNLK